MSDLASARQRLADAEAAAASGTARRNRAQSVQDEQIASLVRQGFTWQEIWDELGELSVPDNAWCRRVADAMAEHLLELSEPD